MLFPPKNQSKFCMSYKQKEVPIYIPMEEYLMENLGILLVQMSIRWHLSTLQDPQAITIRDGRIMAVSTVSVTVKLPTPIHEMLKEQMKKYKMTKDQLFAELIEESYGARKK